MPAANNAKRHGAIKKASARQDGNGHRARVRDAGIDLVLSGNRTHANKAIFGLKGDVSALWNEICDQGWQTNTEIHQGTILKFLGNPFGNEFLNLQFVHHSAPPSTIRSIKTPGTTTSSGHISPTFTTSCASTIAISAAAPM